MKNALSTNIRLLRKSRKLTQEQLANALGVTVGAVSKWEVGTATPELGMLMAIASYFETSLDVLVGYELSCGSHEDALRRITEAMDMRGSRDCLLDAEKYLAKYPNRFDIVYHSAQLFAARGFELRDKGLIKEALELFERSLELIDQNNDPAVDSISISTYIAFMSMQLGNNDLAAEKLKKCYRYGVNDELIGNLLASALNDPLSAEPYLSNALSVTLVKLFHTCFGYSGVFIKKGDYKNAFDISLWLHNTLSPLRVNGSSSYLDIIDVNALAICALCAFMNGDEEMARDLLVQCAALAREYDKTGSRSFEGVRYITSSRRFASIDNVARSAEDNVALVLSKVGDSEKHERITALWLDALNG